MFLIKKLIIVVAILLVSVFGVSLVSRSIEIGSGGSSSDDGYTGIGLPTSGTQLVFSPAPLQNKIANTKYDWGDLVFYSDGMNIVWSYDTPPVLSGKESVAMRFVSDDSKAGFDLQDYSHFKIEFDILKSDLANSVFGCSFSLVGRNSADVSEALSISSSKISVDVKENGNLLAVETYNGKRIEAEKFHVVYSVEVNNENYNQSRMQVFVNDVLYEDSVYYDGLFSNKDVDRLTAVTVSRFNSDSNEAAISFKNLMVTGYNEVR